VRRPRLVFLGSPPFAVPSLRAAPALCDVPLVLTQPDRPAGRGRRLVPTAVRDAATGLGLPVHTYLPRERRAITARLAAMQLDVLLVVAFGHILRPDLMATARCGALNVHASLLPRWRGASPIEQAILAGDRLSGVTLMQLDAGVDTGPMIASRQVAIDDDETRVSLLDKLAAAGAQVLHESLLPFLSGERQPRPQPQEGVALAPRLEKHHGLLHWQQAAVVLERQVRAFYGWPGCFTFLQDETLKVHAARAHSATTHEAAGTILSGPEVRIATGSTPDAVLVACGAGIMELIDVQLPGKKRVAATELLRAGRLRGGMRLHSPEMDSR